MNAELLECLLRWMGGGLQVIGVCTVVWDIRALRKRYDPQWKSELQLLQDAIARLSGRKRQVVSVAEPARGKSEARALTGTATRDPDNLDLDSKIAELYSRFEQLEERLDRIQEDWRDDLKGLEERVNAVDETLTTVERRLKDELGHLAIGNVRIRLRGVYAILGGLLLSTLAPEIPRWLGLAG